MTNAAKLQGIRSFYESFNKYQKVVDRYNHYRERFAYQELYRIKQSFRIVKAFPEIQFSIDKNESNNNAVNNDNKEQVFFTLEIHV